jgi:hypothetical protein
MHAKRLRDGRQNGGSHGVDRRVARLVKNVNGFEMFPERMRGIDEPARSEGIGEQQITELVRHQWIWDSQNRQKSHPNDKRQRADEENCSHPVTGEARDDAFDS